MKQTSHPDAKDLKLLKQETTKGLGQHLKITTGKRRDVTTKQKLEVMTWVKKKAMKLTKQVLFNFK